MCRKVSGSRLTRKVNILEGPSVGETWVEGRSPDRGGEGTGDLLSSPEDPPDRGSQTRRTHDGDRSPVRDEDWSRTVRPSRRRGGMGSDPRVVGPYRLRHFTHLTTQLEAKILT